MTVQICPEKDAACEEFPLSVRCAECPTRGKTNLQPVQPATVTDALERYITKNYPDAKGVTLAERIVDSLERMDIALGMKDIAAGRIEPAAPVAPIPEPKPFPAPGAWFPVNILGGPMREFAPGKWENATWPSEVAPSSVFPVDDLVLAGKIFDHFGGWQSATFGWQGNDPDGYTKAREAHDQKCVNFIAAELAVARTEPLAAPPAQAALPKDWRALVSKAVDDLHDRVGYEPCDRDRTSTQSLVAELRALLDAAPPAQAAEQLSMSMFANKADFEAAQAAQPSQPTDAERYQFIKSGRQYVVRVKDLTIFCGPSPDHFHGYGKALDKAIDAAITASKGDKS